MISFLGGHSYRKSSLRKLLTGEFERSAFLAFLGWTASPVSNTSAVLFLSNISSIVYQTIWLLMRIVDFLVGFKNVRNEHERPNRDESDKTNSCPSKVCTRYSSRGFDGFFDAIAHLLYLAALPRKTLNKHGFYGYRYLLLLLLAS